jgi:hypothetical protein
MWRNIEANSYLRHTLLEYMKVARIIVVMVLVSFIKTN